MGKRHPPIEPDRHALEMAHFLLHTKTPLDELLKQKNFEVIIKNMARRIMRKREQFDLKKMQANDNDY